MAEKVLERPFGGLRQLPDRSHARCSKPRPGYRANTPHQLDWKIVQKFTLRSGIDDDQPIRFRDLRSNLCQVLGARNANGNRQAELCSHTTPNGVRNLSRRSKQTCASRYVRESL